MSTQSVLVTLLSLCCISVSLQSVSFAPICPDLCGSGIGCLLWKMSACSAQLQLCLLLHAREILDLMHDWMQKSNVESTTIFNISQVAGSQASGHIHYCQRQESCCAVHQIAVGPPEQKQMVCNGEWVSVGVPAQQRMSPRWLMGNYTRL